VIKAIRDHLKDFVAIAAMFLLALVTLLVILSNQKAALPSWIPGLGQEFYSINAEFETAQAITPGQGQAAVISGIAVGKVGAASLEDGVAKVRLDIEPKYKDLLHQDAEFLLRPKTGLSDMVVEIDPGTDGPPPEEGSTIPLARGLSNVQLDQFWASLDRETQDYLVLLLDNAGVALDGKGRELSQGLRRFGPFATYTARLNGALEKRRDNISGGVRALSLLATELGNNDEVVADFITNSKNNLQAWADEEAYLREALTEFPSTLTAAREGLAASNQLSLVVKPTLLDLIPGIKRLKPGLLALQSLSRNTTDDFRDDIRPFSRDVQPVFEDLTQTSRAAATTTAQVRGFYVNLNRLLDMLAYNPSGATDEGFLFWAPWLAHNFNSSMNLQDAGGPVRRGISMLTCNTARLGEQVSWNPAVGGGSPQLLTIYRLAQLPPPYNPAQGGICPNAPIRPDSTSSSASSGGISPMLMPESDDVVPPVDPADGATGIEGPTGTTGTTDPGVNDSEAGGDR
jgi:phospholipid/cholesterol/gamma-HCH transport system substrate-binding protein